MGLIRPFEQQITPPYSDARLSELEEATRGIDTLNVKEIQRILLPHLRSISREQL